MQNITNVKILIINKIALLIKVIIDIKKFRY